MLFTHKKPLKIKIAYLISRLSDPILWLLPMGLLIIHYSQASGNQTWLWFIFFVIFLAILPILIFLSKLKKKTISDIDLTKRQERTPIYIIFVVIWAVALVITSFLGGPKLIIAVLLACIIIGFLILFINLKWKISNHTLVATIILFFFTTFVSPKLWWLFLVLPLVAWARIVQKKHTLGQVVAGAFLGVIFFIILKLFGY